MNIHQKVFPFLLTNLEIKTSLSIFQNFIHNFFFSTGFFFRFFTFFFRVAFYPRKQTLPPLCFPFIFHKSPHSIIMMQTAFFSLLKLLTIPNTNTTRIILFFSFLEQALRKRRFENIIGSCAVHPH